MVIKGDSMVKKSDGEAIKGDGRVIRVKFGDFLLSPFFHPSLKGDSPLFHHFKQIPLFPPFLPKISYENHFIFTLKK